MLKEALVVAPALAYPDPTKPFYIILATTDKALSAVLLQKDYHHKLLPVAYESRKLTSSEQNFNQCERECLAAAWAVQKFEGPT